MAQTLDTLQVYALVPSPKPNTGSPSTKDATNAQVATAYEANTNTNKYTNAEKTKLTALILFVNSDGIAEGVVNLFMTSAEKALLIALNISIALKESLSNKATNLTAPDNTKYPTTLAVSTEIALKINATEKGSANGVAPLDGSSKIASTYLPAIAITDTFVVASQVAMLALTAETGDIAVRTDLSKTFILAGTNPAILADWQELLSPTDTVVSVNGQTGAVSLTTNNIADYANKRYVTDAYLVILGNTSNTNSGDNASNSNANAYADAKIVDNLSASATVAPSKDAVNVGLALKFDKGGGTFTGGVKHTLGSYAPAGTTQTIDLNAGNINNLSLASASGNVTLTLTVPTSAVMQGTILVVNGATARNLTIVASDASTIKYLCTKIDTSTDTASTRRAYTWLWDGTNFNVLQSEMSTT